MTRRDVLLLFVLSWIGPLVVLVFQNSPGYMDAEYYLVGGKTIARGDGFTEAFLWNYLDDPTGLPRPGFVYWMPLASVVAALGMKIAGAQSFAAGRLGFLLVSACIPLMTARLSFELMGSRKAGWFAGGLALAPGFYLPYLTTSDTFGMYMLFGAAWMLLVTRLKPAGFKVSAASGAVAAAMHLARADGLLWLVVTLLAAWSAGGPEIKARIRCTAASLAGYLLLMGPWLARNLLVVGAPLSPFSSRAVWLTDYNELYLFPAGQLTFERWWNSGLAAILQARSWAFVQNAQTALAVQGLIFLTPLIIVGGWHLRRERSVKFGFLSWGLTFLVMTFIFPFAGSRGGFFHSGAALQPLFWALTPVGLESAIQWGARVRGWQAHQAGRFFRAGMIILALLFTAAISAARLGLSGAASQTWDAAHQTYQQMEKHLQDLSAPPQAIVMVNNPPGFNLATGWMAVAVPDGGIEAVLAAARQYKVDYLVLEANHPAGLTQLYNRPQDLPGLEYLGTEAGVHYFQIE